MRSVDLDEIAGPIDQGLRCGAVLTEAKRRYKYGRVFTTLKGQIILGSKVRISVPTYLP